MAVTATVAAVLLAQTAASARGGPSNQPQVCGKAQVALLLTQFVSAFNRGNQRQLNTVFAHAGTFRWYSVSGMPGERLDPAAQDRSTLLGYFAARHEAGEHLALTTVTYKKKALGFVDFVYTLTRSADDIANPLHYLGKGAISCFGGPPAIAVWSMGPDNMPMRP